MEIVVVFLIFLSGFITNFLSVWPSNIIVGFDQARDLFDATVIFRDHNLRFIGPVAGNNPNLHHGVLFLYYLIPGLVLFNGSPMGPAIINCVFNAFTSVILYFFAKSLFKTKRAGVAAGIIAAFSFQLTQFSGWLSNPTVTITTVPVFFFGLWQYYKGKKNWLPIAFFFLGITIQFELFFIYLIPTLAIIWIALRLKLPSLKLTIISILSFCLATCTMIATELKFHFAGVLSILQAGKMVGNITHTNFFQLLEMFLKRWEVFYLNISPNYPTVGNVIGIILITFLVFETITNKKYRPRNLFLLIYYFSPGIMLILGYHNAPWFLIGRPSAAILIIAWAISKLRSKFLIAAILALVVWNNVSALKNVYGQGQTLLEPDQGALMTDQLKAIDYTYNSSQKTEFEINTVTNPLYINALWGYQYYWYGKNHYGFLPTWGGGDQVYPYDTLTKETGNERYIYLIMDETGRIGERYRDDARNWVIKTKNSKLVESQAFGAILVEKYERKR